MDCENYMTPARKSRLAARKLASIKLARAAALREWEAAQAAMHGVLPASSPRHHKDEVRSMWIGGILFSDGSVHIFDRDDMEHMDYARSLGKRVSCGSDCGRDGWGFYINTYPDEPIIGNGYKVPLEYHQALTTVVEAMLPELAR